MCNIGIKSAFFAESMAAIIYREVNACADKLAVLGSQGLGYTWWHSPPSFVLRSSLGTGKGFLSTDFCKRLSLSMV